MHWSEKIAKEIIRKYPDNKEYVCAAGISPSGSVHIGNFRDIATAFFVATALRKLGKKSKMLFSWDEYDRLRKIPANVSAADPSFDRYIGLPYAAAPDPFGDGHESYARHFEAEFEKALEKFGIELEFRYQSKKYLAGEYKDEVIFAIDKRFEIYDIIMEHKTQEASEEEKASYYPVSIYCDKCGKDDTHIISVDENHVAKYKCACGHEGSFDFNIQFNCKLAWKIDWPMRWKYEGVVFEPGGKDHAAPGGSYDVSKLISKQIFNYEPPVFQGYEFIGIKGSVGKMSGSTGLNLTPDTLLKVYQPEVILWLYSRNDPMKAFDFCFDDEILRQYFEFDKMLNDYYSGKANNAVKDIMDVFMPGRPKIDTVPMQLLVSFGPVVNWDPDLLEVLFEKIGSPYKRKEFLPRLSLARCWLEFCSPESIVKLNENKNTAFFDALTDGEKQTIRTLCSYLRTQSFDLEGMKAMLYRVVTDVFGELENEEKKVRQAQFFRNVYNLLISRDQGPRLYLFLTAVDKDKIIALLDF